MEYCNNLPQICIVKSHVFATFLLRYKNNVIYEQIHMLLVLYSTTYIYIKFLKFWKNNIYWLSEYRFSKIICYPLYGVHSSIDYGHDEITYKVLKDTTHPYRMSIFNLRNFSAFVPHNTHLICCKNMSMIATIYDISIIINLLGIYIYIYRMYFL